MELLEFLGQNKADQWNIFDNNGVLIERVVTIDAEYRLYRLFDFFIELTNAPDVVSETRMMPFKDGPRLEKYQHEPD